MSNGRSPGKRRDTSRESGTFIALPLALLKSAAYLGVSHTARSLLLEIALQYCGDNNGKLLLSSKHLAPRGWSSPTVVLRAKRELLDAALIFQTVQGSRPNRASWFALTWYSLDKIAGFDAGVEQVFVRGAYRLKGALVENTSRPISEIVAKAPIAISKVVESPAVAISEIAIRAVLTPPPTISEIHHLEKPICGEGFVSELGSGARQKKAQPEKAQQRIECTEESYRRASRGA